MQLAIGDNHIMADCSEKGPIASAVRTIEIETEGLTELRDALINGKLRIAFEDAIEQIAQAKGRVIVTGLGKSGHVGKKIAATLASTGTPTMFMHPSEASHGDLGMITANDVVLALSWSGETAELRDTIAYCRRFGVPLIAITSNCDSALGSAAGICLTMPRVVEACPNRLAPTSSTTVQIAIGDAIAVALIDRRGFSAADFRNFHPGGKLGAQLMMVGEIMGKGDEMPTVGANATLLDVTLEMTRKRYGTAAVIDEAGMLLGAFTDGDLRRSVATAKLDESVMQHMSKDPVTVRPDILASDALKAMNEKKINVLFVARDSKLVGMIHIHDLLHAGVA